MADLISRTVEQICERRAIMRLIDADALNEVMYHEAFETDSDMQKWDSGCWIRYKMFEKAIRNAPTIEAEPVKHGHWLIGVGENGEPIGTYCSECGWSWVNGVVAVNLNKGFSLIKTPRCPWCGAKMDERREDATD